MLLQAMKDNLMVAASQDKTRQDEESQVESLPTSSAWLAGTGVILVLPTPPLASQAGEASYLTLLRPHLHFIAAPMLPLDEHHIVA